MTISSGASSSVNTAGTVSAAVPTLNPYQKIPVIRLSTDVLNYDYNGINKIISVTELGDAIATATPLVVPKIKLDIPVPKIENVITYEKDLSSNYIIQNSYVRYYRYTSSEFNQTLEYIADIEDEIWWYTQYHYSNHNNNRTNSNMNNNNNNNSMNNNNRRQQQSGATTPIDITREDDDYYKIESLLTTNNMAYPTTNTNTNSTSNRDGGGGRNNNRIAGRKMIFPLRMLEHMLDILEKATAFESIITENEADILLQIKLPQLYLMFPNDNNNNNNTSIIPGIQQQSLILTAKIILNDVYNYWVQKRSKLKRPLLRKYWPITSTDDTNPHFVFRPRINNTDRDKYKLRARRVRSSVITTATNNQANNETIIKNTIKKMKYIHDDLLCYQNVISSVIQREEVYKLHIMSSVELFHQRLYELVDTSGLPRKSKRFKKSHVYNQLVQQSEHNNDYYYCYDETASLSLQHSSNLPPNYNTTMMIGKRNIVRMKNENKRSSSETDTMTRASHHHHSHFTNNTESLSSSANPSPDTNNGPLANAPNTITDAPNYNEIYTNIAGKNNGEPAPNFLHPLITRVSYQSNYNHSEPYIRTYDSNSHDVQSTYRFRHRPRIGRGGRVIIDRVPQENYHDQTTWSSSNGGNTGTTNNNNRSLSPPTVYIAGKPLLLYNNPKNRLLDLLPRPLNHNTLSRKIEAISVAAIHEDYYEHAVAQQASSSTTTTTNTAANTAGQYHQQQHRQQALPYPTATGSNSMMMMMPPQQQHHHYHQQQQQQQGMNIGGGISSGSSTMGGGSISTMGRYPIGNESQQPMLSTTTMQQRQLGGVPQSSSLMAYSNNELYDHQRSEFDNNKVSASSTDHFDEVIVPVEEYMETDDQLWGEELYSLGPI